MKTYVPKLIAYCLTVLIAAIHVLRFFSTGNLILMVALLGVLALAVFVGRGKSMVRTAPAFVTAWVYLGVLAPLVPLTADSFLQGLENFFNSLGEALEEPLMLMFLAGFLAAQIFLRKSNAVWAIVLRYITMAGVLLAWCSSMSTICEPLQGLLLLIVILHLSYELLTRQNGYRQPRTIGCLLTGLCCLGIPCLAGETGVSAVTYLLALNTGSLYTVLSIAVLGGLIVLEEKAFGSVSGYAFEGLGGMLIYWSVTALIMLLWPATANTAAMLLGPVILYYAYKVFVKAWSKIPGRSKTTLLYNLIWALTYLGILVLSKCINTGNTLAAVLLLVAPVAAAVCWSVSRKKYKESQIMTSFLGIAAILLLCFSKNIDPANVAEVIVLFLTAVGLGVFWCLLCGQIIKLDRTASAVDKSEFSTLRTVHVYAPLLVLAVAVIRILVI